MSNLPFRQIHLDFHTSAFIPDVAEDFNAKDFVDTLLKANVQSINIFAKCHHGYCYYPSKVCPVHPSLKRDLLGEMLEVCKANGIRTSVYIPTGWEEYSAQNQDFLNLSKASGIAGGKLPVESSYYSWKRLCHNNSEYIDLIKSQIKELHDLYGIKDYWIDIVSQDKCVCKYCRKSMESLGLNAQDDQDAVKHDFIVIKEFMRQIRQFAQSLSTDATVFYNMSWDIDNGQEKDFCFRNKLIEQDRYEIESLPSDFWGYSHFTFTANYLNAIDDKEIIGMNGKFHKAWGDFGSLKNIEALEYECFRMIANGAKCCIGDQLHPRGVLDKAVYKRIGEVFKTIKDAEPYLVNSRKACDIGVFITKPFGQENNLPEEGVMQMLLELHLPFDLIDAQTDLHRYNLLILPDRLKVDGKLKIKLQSFIKDGGKIIASGKSGLINGKFMEEFGIDYFGKNEFCPAYAKLDGRFESIDISMPYVFYNRGEYVKPNGKTNSLALVGKPYFNRTYDKFCSHCQTPFERVTEWSAITKNDRVFYVAYPLFQDYIQNGNKIFRDIFEAALKMMQPKPLVRSNLPSTAELTLRTQGNNLIVHILHYIPQKKCKTLEIIDAKIPLYNSEISVRCRKKPKKIVLLPDNLAVAFDWHDDYATMTVPKIDGYAIINIIF